MKRKSNYLPKGTIVIIFLSFLLLITIEIVDIISACGEDSTLKYKLENSTDILPYPFSRGSAVWVEDQESLYIFGGRNESAILDRIMKYSPLDNKLEILDIRLPTALMGTTAVYNGEYVYIFGGKDYDTFYNSILQFDPKSELITNMTAHLPKPTVGAAGVWTGESIYIFGGCWGGIEPQKFDSILSYDPKMDNITILNSTLSYGCSGLAATWDGENIYIIGGSDGKQFSSEVFKYSPKTDTLITLPGTLPSGRTHTQAIYHNNSIYIFGGRGGPTLLYDQIVIYNLKNDTSELLNQTLPKESEFRMHGYDGENIYIIGGFNGPNQYNQFIKFKLTPGTETCTGACQTSNDILIFYGAIIVILSIIVIITWVKNRHKKN